MSIMLNLNSSLLKLTLCLLFAKIVISSSDSVLLESSVQEPRENTRTHLVSVTMHATSTGVCVKLVNVTGACLRRRGVWVEEPIVLTFDDEMEGEVDMLYTPVLGYVSSLIFSKFIYEVMKRLRYCSDFLFRPYIIAALKKQSCRKEWMDKHYVVVPENLIFRLPLVTLVV
jgi:hypothetical protein